MEFGSWKLFGLGWIIAMKTKQIWVTVLSLFGAFAFPGSAAVLYVNINNAHPSAPYSSWATAATNIQDAVNAASPGDTVTVADGIYGTGQTSYYGSNRVLVTKAITIQSLNGPATTVINGYQMPGTTNGASSVRCICLNDRAVLSGFTLSGGSTTDGGGGILCDSIADVVSNCIIAGNSSKTLGAGVIHGTLFNCQILNNTSYSEGGGAAYSVLVNCLVAGNTASLYGGGVYDPAAMTNCTVADNKAFGSGGGVSNVGSGVPIRNCIVYFNTAQSGSNVYGYVAGSISNCCAPEFALPSCVTNLPGFERGMAGDYRLQIGSPCIGAGDNNSAVAGTDLDGNPRIFGTSVDLGAYENQFSGIAHFVSLGGRNPMAPYTNWLTAATNIQDAIDLANPGEPVIVSNGVYRTGGRVVSGSLTNRVVVNSGVNVASLNGPAFTLVVGNHAFGATAVRCAYLAAGATLSGVTLTNGATDVTGDIIGAQSGGGAWCEAGSTISNCVFQADSGYHGGGGAYSGTLVNCFLTANTAQSVGGGALESTLINCLASNNVASLRGGGCFGGYITNSTLVANYAPYGGGACSNVLVNCNLNKNLSSKSGGGAFSSDLILCLLSGNRSTNGGGATFGSLSGCTLTNNVAGNGGGTCSNNLVNCLLVNNSSFTNGGGAFYGNLTNCTAQGNGAVVCGGGAYGGVVNRCFVAGNGAQNGGGLAYGVGSDCLISNNAASSLGGGVFVSTLSNCTVITNVFGGSYGSTLNGCRVIWNVIGGSHNDTLNNCVVRYNTDPSSPSIYGSTLNNCTVLNNSGPGPATAGVYYCSATNSIIDFNGIANFQPLPYSLPDHCCLGSVAMGPGCFTNAPVFLDAALHLASNSPCIDAGNTAAVVGVTDLDGRARVVNGTVDVGAQEFQGADIEPFVSWLSQYSLPDDGSADYVDSDGSGMNNWQKWVAGLDPTNPASVLKMTSALPASGQPGTTVSWQSVSGIVYYLERSSNLADFSGIQSNLVGQAGTTSYTDATATNGGPYFYRVAVQP
jgi:hypothetical protein